ncbi:MAG: 6-phosphogluconolactonase [Novosphingobium sp.]
MTEPRWAEPGDAAAVAARIAAAVARPGAKRIAVPGGSTPLRIFELLADRKLDWGGATLVLTDDRQVPRDHPASNHGKLSAALGDSGATLVELRDGAPMEPFDLVWLGMGEDGHVASLFPQMAAAERSGPHVIATVPEPLPPEAPFARLSLNLAALVAAGEIILVVTGATKRALLEQVLAGNAQDLPVAQMLRAARSPVTIYWS